MLFVVGWLLAIALVPHCVMFLWQAYQAIQGK